MARIRSIFNIISRLPRAPMRQRSCGYRACRTPLFTPPEALSMGMVTILHAKRIVMLATGAAKARCVERMVNGPLTTMLPASFLQLHRDVEIWLDRAAASRF